MYFEKKISGGRAFMELERRGDRFAVKSRGFVSRYKASGLQAYPAQMATESPLIHDGSQCTLSTAQDARNSTLTGSTQAGPSGSGQFLAVSLSTSNVGRTVSIVSTTFVNASSNSAFYGILQNKPRGGEAADVGIFGISKVVCASTGVLAGSLLQISSTSAGALTLFAGGNGRAVGLALEACSGVGQVITAFVGGMQVGFSS